MLLSLHQLKHPKNVTRTSHGNKTKTKNKIENHNTRFETPKVKSNFIQNGATTKILCYESKSIKNLLYVNSLNIR